MATVPVKVRRWLKSGNVERLERYYNGGGDPNLLDSDGYTQLHLALYRERSERGDRSEVLQLLIRHGADVTQGINFTTPLHFCDFPKEASMLLDAGADINALDDGGGSALVRCFLDGNLRLFCYFIYRICFLFF